MKKQRKRWISALLAMLMLVISLCADTGMVAKAAAKASVSFAELPEGRTLKLEDTYKYDFNAKKTGSANVVYFEVKNGTNTAGVHSSNSGIVYPVTAGQFEIRVVAFASRTNRAKWLDARKKNGYTADPDAEKNYVVASSDWETITVASGTEGLGIARNQSALNKVLKNKEIKKVLIWTQAEREFTIANKNYRTKVLTVKAPNAEVTNAGRFAEINVEQIKASTFREKAKGNKFNVTAPNARIIVEKGARILELIYKPVIKAMDTATADSFHFNLEVKGSVEIFNIAPQKEAGVSETLKPSVKIETAANSNISEIKVEKASDLTVAGEKENAVKVSVAEEAAGTTLTAQAPIKADLHADTTVTLADTAKNSELTVSKKAEVEVKAASEDKPVENVSVKVAKDARGAKLKIEVKVEITVEANITIGGSAAKDSSIDIKGDDITVEQTDEDGNVIGEITPTPTPMIPDITTPVNPSTPTNPNPPTPPNPQIPAFSGKVYYSYKEGPETGEITSETTTVQLDITTGSAIKFFLVESDEDHYTVSADKTELKDKSTDIIITIKTINGGNVAAEYKVTFLLEDPDVLLIAAFAKSPEISISNDAKLTVSGSAVTNSGSAIDIPFTLSHITVTVSETNDEVSFHLPLEIPDGTITQATGTINFLLTAAAKDKDGNIVENPIYTWSSSTTGVTVDVDFCKEHPNMFKATLELNALVEYNYMPFKFSVRAKKKSK